MSPWRKMSALASSSQDSWTPKLADVERLPWSRPPITTTKHELECFRISIADQIFRGLIHWKRFHFPCLSYPPGHIGNVSLENGGIPLPTSLSSRRHFQRHFLATSPPPSTSCRTSSSSSVVVNQPSPIHLSTQQSIRDAIIGEGRRCCCRYVCVQQSQH